ncbi:MAG: hypothetical protein DWQ01_04390 [Planctomycetota bacterium]|nr:MAG: hypothetical protein DWQ01_04390 [Planctomycetota bacterium]
MRTLVPPARLVAAFLYPILWASCWPSLSETEQGGANTNATGGPASETLQCEQVEWGRLVDAMDHSGSWLQKDVLISPQLQGEEGRFHFETQAGRDRALLVLERRPDQAEWASLWNTVQTQVPRLEWQQEGEVLARNHVPRDAVFRLHFSVPLDSNSVSESSVRLVLLDHPEVNLDAELKLEEGGKRLLVIPRLLPESSLAGKANLALQLNLASGTRLRSLNGCGLSARNLPSSSVSSGSNSLLFPFRSGRREDPQSGFMADTVPPELITELEVRLWKVAGSGPVRVVRYHVDVAGCRGVKPKVGDLIEVGDADLLVRRVLDDNLPQGFRVAGTLVSGQLPPGDYSHNPLAGLLTTAYREVDQPWQLCWLQFHPQPLFGRPARGVLPWSTIRLRFSEAMDPEGVKSLSNLVLASYVVDANPQNLERQFDPQTEDVGGFIDRLPGFVNRSQPDQAGSGRLKFGLIEASADGREFTLTPLAGLADSHGEGLQMNLCLALRDGPEGLRDLAGNPLAFEDFVAGNPGQAERIQFAPLPQWPQDRYYALRFQSPDEDHDGFAEFAGQLHYQPGSVQGRAWQRFSRIADPGNPYIGQRAAFPGGIQTPLSPAGAVQMSVLGYHHLGFGFDDPQSLNLDVEGLNWSPFQGQVLQEDFQRFGIALAHSNSFPDDVIDPLGGIPLAPLSGLRIDIPFEENVLGFPEGQETEVYDGHYSVRPGDLFQTPGGTAMMPWPSFQQSFTWRDTGLPSEWTGGHRGLGVPPQVTGQPPVYAAGEVPSIGMPLLMHFRCYPEGNLFGQNGFQTQLMSSSSALPAFRVFSAGGRDPGGNWHWVVPDVPGTGGVQPNGGYHSVTGAKTRPNGPELYWAQIDFAVRVSRAYSHWFSLGGLMADSRGYLLETGLQAHDGQVQVEFRGSSGLDVSHCPPGTGILFEAEGAFDPYGDGLACGSDTLQTPSAWTSNLEDLAGTAQFLQIRLTFLTDPATGVEPALDAMGFVAQVQ